MLETILDKIRELNLDLDLGLNFIIVPSNSEDLYPDCLYLVELNSKGSTKLLGEYKCTINPEKSYKQKPVKYNLIKLEENVKNFGVWQVRAKDFQGLVQTGGPVNVKRGKNGISETGYYGINLYGGDFDSINLWHECSVIVRGSLNLATIMRKVSYWSNKGQTNFSFFILSGLEKSDNKLGDDLWKI